MQLPRIQVDLHRRSPSAQTKHVKTLLPGELTLLLAYDEVEFPAGHPPIDRAIPLKDRRWAVGRRSGSAGTIWRIVDAETATALGHPAWLWTNDLWFDATSDPDAEGKIPTILPLRAQIPFAELAAGNRKRTIKTLAATVAMIRQRLYGKDPHAPIAVKVTPQTLHAKGRPARSFLLALLSCLPPDAREQLRIGVGELAPDPRLFDIIITTSTPNGYALIDASDPPDEGDDLVAYYVRNRLHANDPEAVEAAAFIGGKRGADKWGAGIAKLLSGRVPGVSSVSDEMLRSTPEGAIRAITARLRAGAEVDKEVLTQLIKVTLATRDPRPWVPMINHPATVRAKSVGALLRHAKKLRPKQDLVQVLGMVYPRGADLNPWVEALLGWIRTGRAVNRCVDVLQQTLLDWPLSTIKTTRAAIWTEVVNAMVKNEAYDAACKAVVSPLAREMCRDGDSEAVIDCWMTIPSESRNPKQLAELIDVLTMSRMGELAVVRLFELSADNLDTATIIVNEWCRSYGTGRPDDPLFRSIRDTPALAVWVRCAIEFGFPEHISELLHDAGPRDGVWVRAESAQAQLFGRDEHARFVAMANLSPGLPALEAIALGVVYGALSPARFPDFELSEVARMFISVPNGSALWPWITITASRPGNFDDATIDATVVEFCQSPPGLVAEQELAADCARYLGVGSEWEPLDHARWLVRLAMAPDAGINFNDTLEVALIEGIAARPDTKAHMSAVQEAMLGLSNDHPALGRFLNELMPAWQTLVG